MHAACHLWTHNVAYCLPTDRSDELRRMVTEKPPPHAKLLENHVNDIVSRIRAVVEELRSEEAEVNALEERRDQLLQLLEEKEEGQVVQEGGAVQTGSSEPGVALAETEGGEGSMDDVILVEGAYVHPPDADPRDSPRQDDAPSDPPL